MTKKIQIIICALIFVIQLTMAGDALAEALKEPDSPSGSAVSAGPVKHKVLSFNLEGMTERGEKKWGVKGETAEVVSENEVKINNVVATSFGDNSEATITADTGRYNKSKNNVILEKNVKATIDNVKGLDAGLVGIPASSGVVSDEGKTDKKKTRTVITCDGEAEFYYDKNKAVFTRNVKVTGDDGNIDADKITVNIDSASQKVLEIVAEGNVKMTRGENTTYSEKATYNEAEKKISLTGQPKLVINKEGSLEDGFLGE